MGYYMEQRGANFFVDKRHFPKMIKAIHHLADFSDKMGGGSYSPDGVTARHYSWVNMNFVNLQDIEEIFRCWRWQVYLDEDGHITDISFDGEKLGDDLVLLEAIAPFVKNNSFIEMNGEDNSIWRWKFTDKQCHEINPTIVWD